MCYGSFGLISPQNLSKGMRGALSMGNSEDSIGLDVARLLLEEMPCVPQEGGRVTGDGSVVSRCGEG